MWLSENDNGFWPTNLQDFFDGTEAIPDGYNMRFNTRTPLKWPWGNDDHEFFHGTRPVDGLGEAVHTFIMPMNTTTSTEMDPVEMLLNPEESSVNVYYMYFFGFDWVVWGVGNHVGDIEITRIQFDNTEPSLVTAYYHASKH